MTFNRPYIRRMAGLTKKNAPNLIGSWDMIKTDTYTVLDASNNGNDGTLVGQNVFEYDQLDNKIHFDGVTGGLVVPYDASLDISSGGITLSVWIKFESILGFSSMLSKGNTGSPNYYLRNDDGQIEFYFKNASDLNIRIFDTDGTPLEVGKLYHIVFRHTFGDENSTSIVVNNVSQPSAWVDGGNDLPLLNQQQLNIGNRGLVQYLSGDMYKVEIFSNNLDDVWLNKEYLNGKQALWKSDYGVETTGTITGGNIGRCPARVISGSWRISEDVINNKNWFVLECMSTGVAAIPTGFFSGDFIGNSFGGFDFHVLKATDAGITDVIFVSEISAAAADPNQNGYFFRISNAEAFSLSKSTAGVITNLWSTDPAVANLNQYYHIDIRRQNFNCNFHSYIDDVLIVPTAGTNPVIDVSFQQSFYFGFSFTTGDKIGWSNRFGGNAIIKRVMA